MERDRMAHALAATTRTIKPRAPSTTRRLGIRVTEGGVMCFTGSACSCGNARLACVNAGSAP